MRIAAKGIQGDGKPVSLLHEGEVVIAHPQDTVASALINAGHRESRRTRDGDGRGLFCGMGVCHECTMVIDGVPGRLACLTPVHEGMTTGLQPPYPEMTLPPSAPLPESELSPDLLVIGAGPAGLSAAAAAAEAGLSVLIVDERAKAGGQFYKQPSESFDVDEREIDSQYRAGRRLIARVEQSGVQILKGARVWGAFAPDNLMASSSGQRWRLSPRQLVISTGAYERGVPMPGWTLPGVMTTGAAQTLMRAYQVAPGERVLISGNGPLNMQVAAELTRAGVHVVALVELASVRRIRHASPGARMLMAAPGLIGDGIGYAATLARARVPIITGSAVIGMDGEQAVRSAVVAEIGADGRPVSGTEREFEVDAVCMGFGFVPSNEIARSLGCQHRFDPHAASMVVVSDDEGRTSVDGVWVIGDSGGIGGAKVAEATGTLAGLAAAQALGRTLEGSAARGQVQARRALAASRRFQSALWKVFNAPTLSDELATDDTVVCRCENVTLGAIREAVSPSVSSAGAVKRLTRVGMGPCQGRYCGPVLTEMTARASGHPNDERSGFAPQVPYKPTEVAVIAGEDG